MELELRELIEWIIIVAVAALCAVGAMKAAF